MESERRGLAEVPVDQPRNVQGAVAMLATWAGEVLPGIIRSVPAEVLRGAVVGFLEGVPHEVIVGALRERASRWWEDRDDVLGRFRSLLDVLDDASLAGVLSEIAWRLESRGVSRNQSVLDARDQLAGRAVLRKRSRVLGPGPERSEV